ncbi:hypothetical protein EV421DRAFT_519994 [Armillaria borealis]|uniref:Uncharacterized protein n=1 Tax=Armillaria borealis TaxID=47425 RepID=A0AA39JJ96_9AGAR|nr:hypothetical protein EV421DRAFT_519994 [Armillaria borealis]
MDACNTQLPFELVEIIISEFWYDEHPSDGCIAFMTRCSLVCSLWRDVYASITSQDIYVSIVGYLFYLSSIIRTKKSSIYHPFHPESTRTFTCWHLNLFKSFSDSALFSHIVFCYMPNCVGFRKCFPDIQNTRLELKLLLGSHSPKQRKMFRSIHPNSSLSTCSGDARSFHSHIYCEERRKDIRVINHRFWKAGRTSMSGRHISFDISRSSFLCGWMSSLFSRAHPMICFGTVELPMWRHDCNAEQGFRVSNGPTFTMKHGVAVLL